MNRDGLSSILIGDKRSMGKALSDVRRWPIILEELMSCIIPIEDLISVNAPEALGASQNFSLNIDKNSIPIDCFNWFSSRIYWILLRLLWNILISIGISVIIWRRETVKSKSRSLYPPSCCFWHLGFAPSQRLWLQNILSFRLFFKVNPFTHSYVASR